MTRKQVLKIIGFVVTTVFLVFLLGKFLNFNKEEECLRVYGFYKEPEKSLDITLIGSSEFYRGYLAPLAYDEAGFTSYAVALAAMRAALYKPILQECRKLQDSQLYVIEINGVYYKDQLLDSRLREWFDNVPMSEDKVAAIRELVPKENQSSYFFTFEKYHNNWKNLDVATKVMKDKLQISSQGYTYMKGYDADFRSGPDRKNEKKKSRKMSTEGEKYFTEFLEYLKEENIENVLFVRWPHRNKFEVEGTYDDVRELLSSYGYPFVNFSDQLSEIGIDPDVDFSDNEHLNPLGTEKMTRYFARYIMEHYDIDTTHSQEVTNEWEECRDKALEYLEVCKQKTLKNEGGRCFTDRAYKKMMEQHKKKK